MKKCYHELFCLKILLVFLAFNLSKAFKLKCPSSKQWIIRANSSCLITDGYICLFDENSQLFDEMCINKPYIDPAGYKFVIVGNLDRRKCASSSYQPYTFSTNGASSCIFKKTYCSEEGQITFNNGSTYSDRKCRCDYTRGYDFITKPEHTCYCVPSMEDCSCFQKLCAPGFILSPDYQCINPTSWNSQFTCEFILPYHPKDTTFPSHDNKLDDSAAATERNVRIVLRIYVGVTLILTLIMVQITWYCLPRIESLKDDKKHVLRENIELKLELAGEVIPQNIRDMQEDEKKQWLKKFSHFVETRASKAIFERIKTEQCVIISGPFGCGKSSLAFHTALNLEKTFGFDFMIISNLDDLIKYASKDKKQIFLIDDAFGEYNVSNNQTILWNAQGKSVHQLVKRNNNLRIVMTSRLNIYRSCDLPELKDRCCLFNLISKELALGYEERHMIGRCYLQKDIIDNLSENVIMSYSFFPKLCAMFNIYSNENIVEYFTNPVEYIKTDIQNLKKMKKSSHDMFYLALAVLVLFDNNIHKDIFNDNNHKYDRLLTSVSKGIGNKRYLSKKSLYLSFIALTDSYVSDQDTHFACLHINLFNALASCIGPEIIQKTYFERNLLDMKTAVHNIFIGSQHLTAEFRESYIAYMKKHLTKKDLRKDIDATTVLHLASKEGFAEYVDFFLKLDKQLVKELDNTGQTALHKTCTKGHLHIATLLLENGACIDQSDNDSKTALDIACECDENEMVELLLSRGATIRQKKTDFRSPFHVACNNGNFKVAEILLKYKAEVNQWDYKGYTPLHIACEKGFIEITTMLVTHKANIDMLDLKGETPLFFACSKGHFEVAEILLFNKANVNRFNLLQNTPISIACGKEQIEIIRLLLRYKAYVNCKNIALLTPLHVACRKNNIDIIVLLIKHGALVNEPDANGQTPLFIACLKGYHIAICETKPNQITMGEIIENGASIFTTSQNDKTPIRVDVNERNEEIVKVLLNAGANVNQADSYGITPIHLACKAQRKEIVKLLINAAVDVNKVDNKGISPLDMAQEGGQNEIISLLVEAKVNVNKSDNHSMPPLHMACKEGNEETVKVLLNAGANVNELDNDGLTPLYVACKGRQTKIVTMLINVGVNLNKGDKNGVTPLHIACLDGNEEIVQVLLNTVANVKMMDKDGKTPLDFARKRGHNDIATLLLNTDDNGRIGDKNEITTLHMADKVEKLVNTNDLSIGNVDADGNKDAKNEIKTLHMSDEGEREVTNNDISIGNVNVDKDWLIV